MEPGELKFGVPNIVYDIVQTVGNLLQGEEKLKEYAVDAEKAGDLNPPPSSARSPRETGLPHKRCSGN